MTPPPTIHGSVAALDGKGVLIRGPSGCGKSSLLAALIAGAPPARLVADDRVVVQVERRRVVAAPPEALAGLLDLLDPGIQRMGRTPAGRRVLVRERQLDLLRSRRGAVRCPEAASCMRHRPACQSPARSLECALDAVPQRVVGHELPLRQRLACCRQYIISGGQPCLEGCAFIGVSVRAQH